MLLNSGEKNAVLAELKGVSRSLNFLDLFQVRYNCRKFNHSRICDKY